MNIFQRIQGGPIANRPSAGKAGRWYFATDTPTVSFDNGSSWVDLDASTIGTGTLGTARIPDLAASKITSGTLAEARIPSHMVKSKLAFAANKLLKGTGAGSDPTEIDVETANSILQKIQQFKGVFWFNNHWLPAGMALTSVSGSGSIGWYSDKAQLSTGSTVDSIAMIAKLTSGLAAAASWDKKRYFGVYVYFVTYTLQNFHIITGLGPQSGSDNTANHVGFKLTDGTLYGTVANETTESTLLIETISDSAYRRLEVVFTPASEARFYVDGVDKGAITTNLPSGTIDSGRMVHASVYNTEALSKTLNIYESRTLQEE